MNLPSIVNQLPNPNRLAPRHFRLPGAGLRIATTIDREQHATGARAHGSELVVQRVDHFKQRIALLHPFTGIAQEADHAVMRCE